MSGLRDGDRGVKYDSREEHRVKSYDESFNHLEREDTNETRIGSQLAFMQDGLSKLNALVGGLEERIDQVLIPNMDAEKTYNEGPVLRKPSSELSNTIDDLSGQISRIQGRVAQMLERVQL